MKKFIVFKEKSIIYATIVEAEDEVEAYELCDEDLETDKTIEWRKVIDQYERLLDDDPEQLDLNNAKHVKILEIINSEPEVTS